jgi:hypothetical protein
MAPSCGSNRRDVRSAPLVDVPPSQGQALSVVRLPRRSTLRRTEIRRARSARWPATKAQQLASPHSALTPTMPTRTTVSPPSRYAPNDNSSAGARSHPHSAARPLACRNSFIPPQALERGRPDVARARKARLCVADAASAWRPLGLQPVHRAGGSSRSNGRSRRTRSGVSRPSRIRWQCLAAVAHSPRCSRRRGCVSASVCYPSRRTWPPSS